MLADRVGELARVRRHGRGWAVDVLRDGRWVTIAVSLTHGRALQHARRAGR